MSLLQKLLLWLLLALWGMPALANAPRELCTYNVLSTQAAKATEPNDARPTEGWVPVQLPDFWNQRWPEHTGTVWYRIDWQRQCPSASDAAQEPIGIGFPRIFMAGEFHLNDDLLWRDASLTDPITHGWNTPHWWAVPASALKPGVNTVWVRVVGLAELTPGLHVMQLGSFENMRRKYDELDWRRGTAFLMSNALSAALGCIFLVIWLMRRGEHIYGWFALMSFTWSFYLSTVLAKAPWPIWPILVHGTETFESSIRMARLNLVAVLLYIVLFSIFSFRFTGQRLPRVERLLWSVGALSAVIIVFVPRAYWDTTSKLVSMTCALTFFGTCLQIQWHAWRSRQTRNILTALHWAIYLIVGIHDSRYAFQVEAEQEAWVPFTIFLTTALIALMLGGRLAASMRKVEQFNAELEQRVDDARNELAHALEREHTQRLERTRLQERVRLAHDLHDSLGGSLVRSIAVVERAQRSQQPLAHERMLSLLKMLRDDLRQMIDHGSSVGATVPETPELWMAPLRYRFTRILDELNIAWEWHSDPVWRSKEERPSALQCLGLSRILEEALTNAIKHSRASTIRVWCHQTGPHLMVLQIEDDGAGFDVPAAQDSSGLGVGMRSMAERARRIGGNLSIESSPGQGTVVRVDLALQCQNAEFTTATTTPTHKEDRTP